MSEPFANDQLSAYLDGELSLAERATVESSLEADPVLRAELDALTHVRSFLLEAGPVQAPADFLDSVLAAVEDEPVVQLAWYRRPFGVPLSGLAVAAAALLVIYVALPGGSGPAAPEPGKTGAGAAQLESMKSGSSSSSYGSTKDVLADKVADDANEDAAVMEEAVDPTQNAWEPAEEDPNSDGVAQLDTTTREAGVNKKLALPGKGGFDFTAKPSASPVDKQVVDKRLADQLTPEGAEEGSGDASTQFSRVPYSYTLFTEDAEVLFRLANIAAKHRGEVTGAKNQPLQIEQLTGTDAATVLVKIPAHALQDFSRDLGALGSVRTSSDNTMFAGDPVEVRVTVRLAAGAPVPEPAGKNAARKSRESEAQQLDQVLEAL